MRSALAVAEQLPPEYRGAYADDVGDLDDARRLRVERVIAVPPRRTMP